MQPADEGPCAPKMCRPQRAPYGTMKTFQSKRLEGKSRFDRSAVVEVPLFGDDGHHFTFHPEQPHHFQPHHHHQRPQQHHHQTSVPISSSQQHHPTPQQQQQQQHRFPSENRPSSRVPTSTSAPAASVAAAASPGIQQRRGSSGKAESRFSPDCTYGISSGGLSNLLRVSYATESWSFS